MSPLQEVRTRFGSRAELLATLDVPHGVPNKKLLRLHRILSTWSKEALVEALATKLGRSRDLPYRAALGRLSVGTLYDRVTRG